jgi:uncharacterized protein (DUF486 family)
MKAGQAVDKQFLITNHYMKAFYTILLLIVSNVFMTFAWYGHLKLQEMKVISNWPLYAVILFSWMIALAENNAIKSPLLLNSYK